MTTGMFCLEMPEELETSVYLMMLFREKYRGLRLTCLISLFYGSYKLVDLGRERDHTSTVLSPKGPVPSTVLLFH